MNTSREKVIKALRKAKGKGITHWDFATGFALRSRIAELRAVGVEIQTKLEPNDSNNGRHARYILIRENLNDR